LQENKKKNKKKKELMLCSSISQSRAFG